MAEIRVTIRGIPAEEATAIKDIVVARLAAYEERRDVYYNVTVTDEFTRRDGVGRPVPEWEWEAEDVVRPARF